MALRNVAVLGGSGQVGRSILSALARSKEHTFNPIAIYPQTEDPPFGPEAEQLDIRHIDLLHASRSDIRHELDGVDAVVSALSGKALRAQPVIQDAAADVGVKRFYPSEYGFHNWYRRPGSDWAFVHPIWDQKSKLNERAVLHPAIDKGKMSYTVIGCGDFYNQEREPVWCPWTKREPEGDRYKFHVIGSADEKADFTHIDDFADYLVATLCEPQKSENTHLNFVSETISHREIARLLRKYSGKEVDLEMYSEEDLLRVVEEPGNAPEELKSASHFPVDFWYLVKGAQGSGHFRRPKGKVHNHLFPQVKPTTFEDYFRRRFCDHEWTEMGHGAKKKRWEERLW